MKPRIVSLILVALLATLALTGAAQARPADQPSAPSEDPVHQITVKGNIRFIDRNNVGTNPARGVLVEVWDRDPNSVLNVKLGQGTTDSRGYYQIGPLDNRRPDTRGRNVYINFKTQSSVISVLNQRSGTPYLWDSRQLLGTINGVLTNVPDGEVVFPEMIVPISDDRRPALEIMSSLYDGWSLLQGVADPGNFTAVWSSSTTEGPTFDSATNTLLFRAGDPQFPDLILYTQAKAVLYNNNTGADLNACPAGDPADRLRVAVTPRCAWLDGFSIFFAVAARNQVFPNDTTFGTVDPNKEADIEAATWGTPGWQNGDGVPGRVAGALWDLYDSHNDGYDMYSGGIAKVWNAVHNHTIKTMLDFWASFRSTNPGDSCIAIGAVYQNTIDYDVAPRLRALPGITTPEDTPVERALDLFSYATDDECAAANLSYGIANTPDPGAGISLDIGRYISVRPVQDWFGTTNVVITITDGLKTVTGTFQVDVIPVNDPAYISDDMPLTYEALVGHSITLTVTQYGRDVDNTQTSLQWSATYVSNHPLSAVSGQGTQILTFTPLSNTEGIDVVRVRVQDPLGSSDTSRGTKTVSLRWTPAPNSTPTISPAVPNLSEYINRSITLDLTGYGHDNEDGSAGLSWFATGMMDSTVSGNGSRVLTFTPNQDFIGSDTANLEVKDNGGLTARQAISLTWSILPNQAPFISPPIPDKRQERNHSIVLNLRPYSNDVDNPVNSLIWYVNESELQHSQISGQGTQVLIFTPEPNYTGTEIVTLHLRDPNGAEIFQSVHLTWEVIFHKLYLPVVDKNMPR
ncbi:MAG: hypothetical protein EXR62_08725 [Chloroflexi bacterium]|nr:hypothetical protein [Chloroflexota bacterium]